MESTTSSSSSSAVVDIAWLNSHATYNRSKQQYALSVFSFPIDLIGVMTVSSRPSKASMLEVKSFAESLEASTCFKCRMCALEFESVAEMRNHYKSNDHLSHLMTASSYTDGADNAEFATGETGPDKETETLSESDSSVDSDHFEDNMPDSKLISDKNEGCIAYPEGTLKKQYSPHEGLRSVFRPSVWNDLEFSISTVVSTEHRRDDSMENNPWTSVVRALQTYSINPMWCVISLRSGRFAGAIFDGNKVISHKAFRR